MADDIDDLLNEVEIKFCTKSPAKPSLVEKVTSSNSRPKSKSKQSKSAKSKEKDELDSIIDDIIDFPEPLETISHRPGPPSQSSFSRQSAVNGVSSDRKCFPVFLGGSSTAMGVGSTVIHKACDQLRCTSCDFKVVFYDDFEWDQSCNYLFFRNNVPDFQKLRAKLRKKKDCRAYACQCCWRSLKAQTDLSQDHDLKWVCGKHVR
ncbi:protein C8orf37 [Strongylocentrotus purpuratus]|uniref:Cilia- and flagella-associated protein 418 n=1 Tax=Strongylocentrotus purpuratus TaxID=7668 RepID=A0A7M7SU44_STRPU|nr:protein C8orf37 [Strongylocentrotus purpuratus]